MFAGDSLALAWSWCSLETTRFRTRNGFIQCLLLSVKSKIKAVRGLFSF